MLIARHGLDVWVYRGPDWFVRDAERAPRGARAMDRRVRADRRRRASTASLDGVVKIVGVSDDSTLVARCETECRDAFGEQVSAARSQPYYLDVTHPDANKGVVVSDAVRSCSAIPSSEIATIGDMPNDVLMFARSGLEHRDGQCQPRGAARGPAGHRLQLGRGLRQRSREVAILPINLLRPEEPRAIGDGRRPEREDGLDLLG